MGSTDVTLASRGDNVDILSAILGPGDPLL